jgi:hypothetical protein
VEARRRGSRCKFGRVRHGFSDHKWDRIGFRGSARLYPAQCSLSRWQEWHLQRTARGLRPAAMPDTVRDAALRQIEPLARRSRARGGPPIIILCDSHCYWARDYSELVLSVSTESHLFWDSQAPFLTLGNLLLDAIISRLGDSVEGRVRKMRALQERFDAFHGWRRSASLVPAVSGGADFESLLLASPWPVVLQPAGEVVGVDEVTQSRSQLVVGSWSTGRRLARRPSAQT